MRNGRNFTVKSTKEEKFVAISEWKADRLTLTASARLMMLWVPAFMKTQSMSGFAFVILVRFEEPKTLDHMEETLTFPRKSPCFLCR